MTECLSNKETKHKVKVASKFHQKCSLFTVDIIVLEHTFDS